MSFENRVIHVGDNLDVMRGMESETYDLIYADPPFNSNKTYKAAKSSEAAGSEFDDKWMKIESSTFNLQRIGDYNFNLRQIVELAGEVHSSGMRSYLTAMSLRLIEMRRLLKPDGAIYFHCDDSADYFLRALMDVVFGADAWVSTIHRKRHISHNDKTFGRIVDVIHVYGSKPNDVWTEPNEKYIENSFNKKDEIGFYLSRDLTGPNYSGESKIESWRGFNPSERGRHWAVPSKGEYAEYIDRRFIPGFTQIKDTFERLDALDAAGHIHWTSNGTPRLKMYYRDDQKQRVPNLWLDCMDRSTTGFPTEKSLDAMKRIVEAATNEGDKVLDAFCGSGTTCIAAESLGREWNSIELSESTARFAKNRMVDIFGMFGGSQVQIKSGV